MREYIPKKRGLLSFDWYVPINLGILILVMLIFLIDLRLVMDY
nr:hypothetical protein [Escherichia coli]